MSLFTCAEPMGSRTVSASRKPHRLVPYLLFRLALLGREDLMPEAGTCQPNTVAADFNWCCETNYSQSAARHGFITRTDGERFAYKPNTCRRYNTRKK